MLIGHNKILTALERLAEARELSHAYLFWGPARVGKKTAALALARSLEKGISSFAPMIDSVLIAPPAAPEDGTDIGIDEVRRLVDFVLLTPLASPYRIAIVDEAHRMTSAAQNALLKTAESPPPSGVVILVTPHPELLTRTLTSRFQKIYFAPVSDAALTRWLREEVGCSEGEAGRLAAASFGAPGRALTLHTDKKMGTKRKSREALAAELLKCSGAKQRDMIKKLVADDAFVCEEFLDAMIDFLTQEYLASATPHPLWHRVLALRDAAQYFNVNPRLQLEALLQQLKV
jgi:DNA polymerase-3 subunit delta'